MTPIVLIPGLLCSAEVFARQVAALWPYGPVTVASTLKGRTMAEIAAAILEEAPPRFALAGISMGGHVCFEIMRRAPERVFKLALLNTTARPDTDEQITQRQALVERARREGLESLLSEVSTYLFHPTHRSDPELQALIIRMGLAVGIEGFARQTEALIARPDSRPGLASITVPTLVLVGDSDLLTPLERSEEIAAAIPGARLVVIPQCGHGSTGEQPEAVCRAMVEWIV
jgi:pimeloyl-ACP methyl ester carboxylesterase